jgi:hypothetical protein
MATAKNRTYLVTNAALIHLLDSPELLNRIGAGHGYSLDAGDELPVISYQLIADAVAQVALPQPYGVAWVRAEDWAWGEAEEVPAGARAGADGKTDEQQLTEEIEMLTIKVKRETLLKAELKSSSELPKNKLLPVSKDKSIPCVSCVPDKHQHVRIKLAHPASNGQTVFFAYAPHIALPESAQSKINLNVPHFDQIDNETNRHGTGGRQCNLTSASMLAAYCIPDFVKESKAKGYVEPESYLGEKVAAYGDTTDHSAITKGLRNVGIESYFSYALCPKDLMRSLTQGKLPDGRVGIPVLIGVAFKASGHMVIVRGRDEKAKKWFLNDPFGSRAGVSNSYAIVGNKSGENDEVSDDWMDACYWDVGDAAGWGRIVTSVNGVPTGLPTGL